MFSGGFGATLHDFYTVLRLTCCWYTVVLLGTCRRQFQGVENRRAAGSASSNPTQPARCADARRRTWTWTSARVLPCPNFVLATKSLDLQVTTLLGDVALCALGLLSHLAELGRNRLQLFHQVLRPTLLDPPPSDVRH